MKKINTILAFLLMFTVSVTAQKAKKEYYSKNTKLAEKAFDEAKYQDAIILFDKAYKKAKTSKDKGFITYHLGLIYEYTRENKKAKQYFERALRLKYDEKQPDIYTRLGEMQMQDGEYKDARKNFEMALKKNSKDELAKKGLESCKQVNKILANPTKHKVQVIKELSTDDFNWSVSQFDKKGTQYIFSSTRKASTGSEAEPIMGYERADLYVTTMDRQGNFGEPTSVGESVNTKENEASAVMYNNGNSMMFTRCLSRKNEDLGCQIYTTNKKGKNWSTPEKLELVDSAFMTAAHPATDRKGTYIVFASDMPGGRGGKDLWISEYNKREKSWGTPRNLGPEINTAGDEKFPTIASDGTLYYSSDGLVGLGGLDMYKATAVKGVLKKWQNPENLGTPLNSSKDDHGIIFNSSNPNAGYFSSARLGKNERDLKSDIFSFDLPGCALTLKGRVRDQDSLTPLAGATVTLTGSDGSTATIKTDSEGNFEFGKKGKGRYINKGVNYNLVFEAEHHLNKKTKRVVSDDYCNETFYEDIKLLCFDCDIPITMPEVQYIFGTADLQVNSTINSKDSLLFLYNVMIDNPTIRVQLEAHTDCRGSDIKNQELSQRRAQTCVDYLISKGIDRSRLVARGYGEAQPRVIQENGRSLTLSCEMITSLKTSNPANFDRYHQLNRRTTFSVIEE